MRKVKIISVIIIALTVLGIIGGCGGNGTDTTQNDQSSSTPNLGVTTDQFESSWSDLQSQLNTDLYLGAGQHKTGSVNDTAEYVIKSYVGIVTTIDKDSQNIKEVTVISQPQSDSTGNAEILLCYGLAIGAVSPSLTASERGEIFNGLVNQNPQLEEKTVTYTKGDIEYSLIVSKTTGMWLDIKPATN